METPKNLLIYFFDFYIEPKSPIKTLVKNRDKYNTKYYTVDIFQCISTKKTPTYLYISNIISVNFLENS
jgi:hypothetical protein